MIRTATPSSDLAKALAQFRATREHTLAMVNQLTQTQLDYAPAPQRWSIGEILDHVLLGEQINREQIAKLIEKTSRGEKPELSLTFSDLNISVAGVPRSVMPVLETPITLMNMFVPNGFRNYLTRTRLIPFRNPDAATPRRRRTAAELRNDLVISLRETELLFHKNPDLDFARMIVRHPLLGSYDVPGLLRFMAAHEERHQSQIAEVRVDTGFPGST